MIYMFFLSDWILHPKVFPCSMGIPKTADDYNSLGDLVELQKPQWGQLAVKTHYC